jgi:sugar/nucleoside kinase (ribokinase family)
MSIDVFGLGNPLVDILAHIDDEFLKLNNLNKGIMHLIDEDQKNKLLDSISNGQIELEAGGACPNTIATLGLLGLNAALAGKVGTDELGSIFKEKIIQKKVNSYVKTEKGITGTSIILITPDKERTMNTHLGVNREYKKEDLPVEVFRNTSIFYFTGYMWDTENQKEATRLAMESAAENDVKIVFDVADPFAVERYRDDFLSIIKNQADIVLANAQEAEILTKLGIAEAAELLGRYTEIAVVKNGEKDSHIYSKGKLLNIPSFRTDVLDTTGAGDNFSAGFIFGLIKKYPLELCGTIASFVASKTIEKIGSQAPDDIKKLVEHLLENHRK